MSDFFSCRTKWKHDNRFTLLDLSIYIIYSCLVVKTMSGAMQQPLSLIRNHMITWCIFFGEKIWIGFQTGIIGGLHLKKIMTSDEQVEGVLCFIPSREGCNCFWICSKMPENLLDFFGINTWNVIYDATLEGPEIVGNSCGPHFQLLTFRNIVDVLLSSRDIWAYFTTSQVKTSGLLAPVTWSPSQTTLMRSWWRRNLCHMKQPLWECWFNSGSRKKYLYLAMGLKHLLPSELMVSL